LSELPSGVHRQRFRESVASGAVRAGDRAAHERRGTGGAVVSQTHTPRRQAQALAKVHESLERARTAAGRLRTASGPAKDHALRVAADTLTERTGDLLAANADDLSAGEQARLAPGVLDRLRLTEQGIAGLVESLRQVAELPDPVDEQLCDGAPGVGGNISQLLRIPLGVIGVLYEAQPAVTVEMSGLVLKAGNAVLLRGAPAALRSDAVLLELWRDALTDAGLPPDGVQLLDSTERSSIQHLIAARGMVDLLVLRGGSSLVRSAGSDTRVPTIELGPGNSHIYIDAAADLAMAERIVLDSKFRQPAMPHSARTVLVHTDVAPRFIPTLVDALRRGEVAVLGDARAMALAPEVAPLDIDGWQVEYLGRKLAIGVLDSLDEAVTHINRYASGNPQVIVTDDLKIAHAFVTQVDAASVRINVPTGAPDAVGREAGGLFSTQKLHARGPVGPQVFTTTKWVTWPGRAGSTRAATAPGAGGPGR
jgi:glutamate-5-semialdehyde dehydrogenase